MRKSYRRNVTAARRGKAAVALVGAAAAGLVVLAPAAGADPLWPGGPDVPGVPTLIPPNVVPQNLIPPNLLPEPPKPAYYAPGISPTAGEVVGGKRVIDFVFGKPIEDRAEAESTIKVTANKSVPGHFEWIADNHLQWLPDDFWPRGTQVSVEAAGAQTEFAVSDEMTSVADAGSHEFTVKIGGDVVKTFPASLGKPGHESPNGTFTVLEKLDHMIMDSSTYGVPIDAPEGYRTPVDWATRITWGGIFVHSAPWSVNQQGNSNVSHGCINLSPTNAKWFFDNVRNGDQVSIVNA
ncbi:MAG TPA: L,D-transpeptidase [Aldersonia sp.]